MLATTVNVMLVLSEQQTVTDAKVRNIIKVDHPSFFFEYAHENKQTICKDSVKTRSMYLL